MAVDRTPVLKRCRQLGIDPVVMGINKESHRQPRQRRRQESEYGQQLREKQKAKFIYGVLENQFRGYYDLAKARGGITGDNLMSILESRLDNVIYRAGFAQTRRQARQLVVHGHFLVNGQKVNIPSFRVSQYDVIDVRPKSMDLHPLVVAREIHGEREVPAWMDVRPNKMRILIHQLPVREQIVVDVQEQMIVELYSK